MGALSSEELNFLSCFVNGGVCKVRLDDDFTLLYGNDEFYRIYGYSKEEMTIELGNRLIAVIDEGDIEHIGEVVGNAYANQDKTFEFEKHITRRDGQKVIIYTKGTFVVEDGETVLYNVISDITEQKKLEEQHRIDEQRIKIALEQAADIIFDYDIRKKTMRQTVYAAEIYGTAEYIDNVPESLIERGFIPEEHVEEVRSVFRRVAEGDAKASCVVRLRGINGQYVWNRIILSTLYDEHHKPVQAIGVLEDISKEKEAELAVVKEERYRKAMIPMSVSHAQVNVTRNTLEEIKTGFSQYQDIWDGETYEEYVQSTVQKYVHIAEREAYLDTFLTENLKNAFMEGRREIRLDHRRLGDNGRYVWLMAVMYLLEDPFTEDLKGLFYLRNINKEKQEEMRLKYQSRMDSLTMLYNKRNFEEQVKKYLSDTDKGSCHAFMILDVDDFKMVNDTYGHMFGDQVLKQIAEILKKNLRSVDVVGRIGGDEYALFLKDSGGKAAAAGSAGRIVRQIEEAFGEKRKITCSIGAAMYPGDGETFEDLYQNADAALYNSKRNGKGCTTFYEKKVTEGIEIPISRTKIDEGGYAWADLPRPLDMSIADEIEDAIYISDPETYEIKFANKFIREQMNFKDDEYVGQKCYKALQGLDEPCPFCTNKYLNFEEYYVWENKNRLIERQFMMKDKLIMWQGIPARFEYAVDITEKQKQIQDLKERDNAWKKLIGCIGGMFEQPTLEEALQIMVKTAADAYKAERAYIFEYDDSISRIRFMEEWCREDVRSRKTGDIDNMFSSTFWAGHLKNDETVFVQDIEEIRIPNIDEYKWMVRYKVRSLAAVSYSLSGKAAGFIVVENPSRGLRDLSFLKSLGYFAGNVISERKLTCRLEYMGYHDSLTGLLGGNGYARWKAMYKEKTVQSAGMLVLDMNMLKDVNERYGHARGDKILIETAEILKTYFDEQKIFRLNGDQFIAVSENISEEEFDKTVMDAEKMLQTVGYDGAACGSAWTGERMDILTLQGIADGKMRLAKKQYHRSQRKKKENIRPSNAKALLEELKAGYYYVYLQPKVNMESGEVIGAEALARYTSPEHGTISPEDFIQVMEAERLVRYLDLYMAEEVCRMLSIWHNEGKRIVPVALNLSRVTLVEEGIARTLKMILDRYHVPAKWIELEMTEGIGKLEEETLIRVAGELQQEGFKITLDDFGMKYTNTSMLVLFELQTLKIDRSLIHKLEGSARKQAVVRHICSMCEELGAGVVAEGIEKEEQMQLLKELGCREAQGYFFGRPMPPEEFIKFIQ